VSIAIAQGQALTVSDTFLRLLGTNDFGGEAEFQISVPWLGGIIGAAACSDTSAHRDGKKGVSRTWRKNPLQYSSNTSKV
jgi:hypothetical protein